MQRLRQAVANLYFSFDTRSLALFRFAFASVLLVDLYLRSRVLDEFYTNDGLLPNHTVLWAPIARHTFSLFFTASHHDEALALLLLCALAFTCLLVGFKTRMAQFAAWICLVSLDARIALLENGGDVVLNQLALWTLFLPLGERFSIDALLRSVRAHKEHEPAQLNERNAYANPARRVYSLACGALITQLFVIYLFNVLHKNGPTWLEGTAVHYTLHQDRLVKPFGIFLREHLPVDVLKGLAWGSIGIEALGAALIVSPFLSTYTRLAAVILMPLLHLTFELCLDLGIFSFAMMAFFALLPLPQHWEFAGRWLARRHRRRRVFVDSDCGFCVLCARILSRLDVFERLQFASNTDTEALPSSVSVELADTTVVAVDLDSGHVHTRAAAFNAILHSLPGGFMFAWPLWFPGMRQVANVVYDAVARNRRELSVWLGYTACGVPLQAAAADPGDETSQARLTFLRARRWLREGCVAIVICAATAEMLNANAAVPVSLHFERPQWLRALVEYPRTLQAWRMFAPHAPLEDYMIEIDAVTRLGKHVDPYNAIASRVPGPGYTSIPARLHQNQFFTAYSLFIWMPPYAPYLTALREWILRYPTRTGNPNDAIVSFKAYKLSDTSPAPGQTQPYNFRRELFLSYP